MYAHPRQNPTFGATGIDVAGQAQTGTGKTAAFLLATFQYLLNDEAGSLDDDDVDEDYSYDDEDETDDVIEKAIVTPIQNKTINYPRAIILAPTRELAIQIHKDALLLSKRLNLSFALVYGGTDYQKQLAKVKANVDIIIGTPAELSTSTGRMCSRSTISK